jgi:putative NIF3 family GTP cyclohydrolase 1 type 2
MALTIQQAIDTITASVPGAPFPETVDTIKLGDASQEITSIVITFMGTVEVIEKAIKLGANFIIVHEPTFYNHPDTTDWLAEHPTYKAKRELIEKNKVVIWRFHDYLHSIPPDATFMGMVKALGWENNVIPENYACSIKPMTLRELAEWVKKCLGVGTLRVVGNLEMICQTVQLWPGFPPPSMQIGSFFEPGVDVVIAGEIHEWETSEYVRDATQLGYSKGLIVTGHAASEEPGMEYMIPWLQERLPGVEVHFIRTSSAFQQL